VDSLHHRDPERGAVVWHCHQPAEGWRLVLHPGPKFILLTMLTLTTGSAFIMWLGEQITTAGSHGMSLLNLCWHCGWSAARCAGLVEKAKNGTWERSRRC